MIQISTDILGKYSKTDHMPDLRDPGHTVGTLRPLGTQRVLNNNQ